MHDILPSQYSGFTVTNPRPTVNVPICSPRRKKGKKRKNMFTGPPTTDTPGSRVRFDLQSDKEPVAVAFHPETLRLPILHDGPSVLLDDRGFPNRQRKYNFVIDQYDGVNFI